MKKSFQKVLLSAAACVLSSSYAVADSHYVQCWASGHSVRQTATPAKDNAVNARFALTLEVDKDGVGQAKELIGHVEVARFVEGQAKISLADYYAVFTDKNHRLSLSPRATKYKDDKYFRLREVNASDSTHSDGGGMYGYLVINKDVLKLAEGKTTDGHYVLQSGDHFGGTIDYKCSTN